MTHHLYCGMTYPLSMRRVIAQFHKFMYIFNCCILVGELCLKIVSTCVGGRVMGVSIHRTPRRPGVMRMTVFPLSPIKYHVMSSYLHM
jgi:hypothetical protein